MTRLRQVDRFRAQDYLKRAEECLNATKSSFEREEFNASVITAVHCGISSADALCISIKGIRHAGERHDEALRLFLEIDPQNEDIRRNSRHLHSLLQIKTDAEYGERLIGRNDAEMCMKHAERLLSFVKSRISR